MTYKVCYWDSETNTQMERDATPDEEAEINQRILNKRQNDISSKWEEIKAERDRRSTEGGCKVGDHWFHSDLRSRTQQLQLARKADIEAMHGGDLDRTMVIDGIPLYWKTMSGEFVPMTYQLALDIPVSAETQELLNFKVAEQHKAALLSSQNPEDYDYSGLWPEIYVEIPLK